MSKKIVSNSDVLTKALEKVTAGTEIELRDGIYDGQAFLISNKLGSADVGPNRK